MTVPTRQPNSTYRPREFLTEIEVAALVKAAWSNRDGRRDAAMVLCAYRHGLRASEICTLKWSQIDGAVMHVRRIKNGRASSHPIMPDEAAALARLPRTSEFVFTSERGTPFTPAGFGWMVKRLGRKAGFEFPVHCHMLRHACGFYLANKEHPIRKIQNYLGHKNVQHTVAYTALVADQFKNFWREAA
ncbi:MAG TPA: tyrosine-type recombinase/integrase [Steroidobacteraceae bacterium]|nr:tyrosine-type recombinase/integrase [Steroidobacteraceae bacterium]